ncbi:FAD-dependent monooxygenase [Bdellovibrio sp. HCB337]|uniref:FAD-dependent monooxygenase n=1 Tax=Bdellovibrio sp. HCB337 TaxID=3394358 RepID=UPI0039A5819B
MTHQTDVDVLIVGAGPTGLTLACLLAQYGVSFKVIEKNRGITERSKALGVQARTLELFEQLGLAQKAVDLGHPAKGLDLMVNGKRKVNIDLQIYGKGMTEYPYILILEQSKTESLLLEKLQSLGRDVDWQTELVDLQQHASFVTASVSHYEKIDTIKARYLIAADGARSTIRTLLRLPFEGGTYENRFLLADVALEGPIHREHITVCSSREGFAGFFPMVGEGRFRVIGMLPDHVSEKADQDFELMKSEIRAQSKLNVQISDPRWISAYKIHHRNVVSFREQRCFFAGDAAHVHSPAGAQGMNTGIQDAFNLAWKLWFVTSGWAHDKLLDTYHEERFPVARALIRTTDRVFGFVTNRGGFVSWLRLKMMPLVLRLLLKNEDFRKNAFAKISQIAIRYRKSSLTEQNFLSEGMLRAGDRFCHPSPDGFFHAFVVGCPEAQESVAALLERYFRGQVHVHTLNKRLDTSTILQSFGIFKDGLILVRPDGYVGYCAEGLDMSALPRYLDRYFIPEDYRAQKEQGGKEAFPFESFI